MHLVFWIFGFEQPLLRYGGSVFSVTDERTDGRTRTDRMAYSRKWIKTFLCLFQCNGERRQMSNIRNRGFLFDKAPFLLPLFTHSNFCPSDSGAIVIILHRIDWHHLHHHRHHHLCELQVGLSSMTTKVTERDNEALAPSSFFSFLHNLSSCITVIVVIKTIIIPRKQEESNISIFIEAPKRKL